MASRGRPLSASPRTAIHDLRTSLRRGRRAFAPGILAAFLLAVTLVQARPGDLDRSFGTNGKVRTNFGGEDQVHSMAIDSHGRIVAAGDTSPSQRSVDFAVARYRRSGDLDRTFSRDGRVTTDLGGYHVARSVAIDSRGRIVAAGGYGRPTPRPVNSVTLARYRPNGHLDASTRTATLRSRVYRGNGSLDRSFSRNGKVTKPKDRANSVAIDSRNRIVAAGSGRGRLVLARYIGYSRG